MTAAVIRRGLPVLLMLALPAAQSWAAVGCRDALSKAAYERAMRAVDRRYDPVIMKAESDPRLTKPATAAEYTRRLGLVYRAQANALAAIEGPAEIAGDHPVFLSYSRTVARPPSVPSRRG